jgi:predicted transcriptional regulator of viral defense system
MSGNHLIHTALGVDLVRKLAAAGDRIFTNDRARELAPSVGLSEGYLRQALHHLAKSGWIVRLRHGLYSISSTVPGMPPTHEFETAMHLVNPAAVSHWSALHYHGLTEQIPQNVYITTSSISIPRLRGAKTNSAKVGYPIGDVCYRFIQVKPARFFGTEKVWCGDARITMTDPERTLLDGLAMPQHCGDFAEVLHAFETRGDKLDVERITKYALRLDAATAKRLGWVMERNGVDTARLRPLAEIPIKGYRTLDPTGPRKGPCNRRWMIQENLPGRLLP